MNTNIECFERRALFKGIGRMLGAAVAGVFLFSLSASAGVGLDEAALVAGERVEIAKENRLKDFRLSFEVAFATNVPRRAELKVFFPQHEGAPAASWHNVGVAADFCSYSSIGGWVMAEPCGLPFFGKDYFDLSVPDDAVRRVELRAHDGYLTVFVERDGTLQRTCEQRMEPPFCCAALQFAKKKGVRIRNVRLEPLDPALLPRPRDGFSVATTPKTVEIPVTDALTRFDFVPGGYPVVITAAFRDGTNACTASFASFSQDFEHVIYPQDKKDMSGNLSFQNVKLGGYKRIADSGMSFACGKAKLPIYTIPKMGGRYRGIQVYHMLTNLTACGEVASKHVFGCELRKLPGCTRLYVDGDYCCSLPLKDVKKVELRLPEGACWRSGVKAKAEGVGVRRKVDPLLEPIHFDAPFDTSACQVNLGSHLLECDGYLSRCPQEAAKDSFLRRIPQGTYLRARVRCRLGGNTNRNTFVTARITNFYAPFTEGRNPESIDQQTKEIPRGTKGEVELVFDFDPGAIQDVIWQRGFNDLTFEVLGDCVREHGYLDTNYLHPRGTSDVTVLGATLERSPAGLCVANANYGNFFYATEKPGFKATVEALVAGDYTVEWRVKDVCGRACHEEKDALRLAASERRTFDRTFPFGRPGWYGVTATLRDATGRALVTHKASYVLLAPDTRKAGYESPFFTWTPILMAGRSTNDLANAMELCRRGGIRHAQPGAFGEKDCAAWGVTCSPLPRLPFSKKPTLAEREADYEKAIREQMTRFPHANATTIFHESYPPTRRGQKPNAEADAKAVRNGTELCRVWRRLYPDVRLVLGNSGNSIDKMDQLFRAGFPKDLIDTIGEESVGGPEPSEKAVAEHFMNLKDLAHEYGYDHVGIEACYEWKIRQHRNYDTERQRAAMLARDALVALAWGAKNVTLNMTPDHGNCYFTTCWGSGTHSQEPVCHPYPAAAATATLTLVLDRCTFSHLMPTGSETVYAVAFRNPEGTYVTALWTSKGSVKAKVAGDSRKLVVTDLYGASETVTGLFRADADVTISEEPLYITSAAPLKSVTPAGKTREYTFERYPGSERAKVLPTGPAADWTIHQKVMAGASERARLGKTFSVRDVEDEEKGAVLELAKGPEDKGYTVGGIRLKQPVAIPADATTLGVWVKGNSSRGRLYFEVEDAAGHRYTSTSRYGYDDWSEKIALDFDGWRLVWIPLKNVSPVRVYVPENTVEDYWRSQVNWNKRDMTWPLRLRGVSFAWKEEVVHINEKRPVTTPYVRIGAFETF